MKTQSIWTLLIVLLAVTVGNTQPPYHEVEPEVFQERIPVEESNCVDSGFNNEYGTQYPQISDQGSIVGQSFNKDFELTLNKDCPAEITIPYWYTFTGNCNEQYIGWGYSVSRELNIKFNDVIIEEIAWPPNGEPEQGNGIINLSTDIPGLSSLASPAVYELQIVYESLTTTLSGVAASEEVLGSVNILIIPNGMNFILKEFLSQEVVTSCEEVPQVFENYWLCNGGGGDPDPMIVAASFTQSNTNTNTLKLFGNVEVGGQASASVWSDFISISGSGSGGVNWSHIWENVESQVLSVNHSATLDPSEGQCAWVSFQASVENYKQNEVTVTCGGLMHQEPIFLVHDMDNFHLYSCSGPELPSGNCDDCPTEIQIIGNGNRAIEAETCTFDLQAIPCADLSYLITYTWVFQDGTEIFGPVATGVPVGIYTLRIEDQCGGFSEMEVNVCPNPSYDEWSYYEEENLICSPMICGETICNPEFTSSQCIVPDSTDWVYYENSQEFCRIISCPPGAPCDGNFTSFEQCTSATFGEWEYDDWDEVCERDVLLSGEPSGYTQTSEPEYIYDYDDFLDECIRIVICGGEEVDEETEDPEYGDWKVEDDFFDGIICLREVICFGDSDNNSGWEEEVNDEPEIEWEYDDFFDECNGQVFCDGFGGFNPDVEIEAEAIFSNWDIPPFSLECTASISCEYEGEVYETDLELEVGTEIVAVEIDEIFGTYFCLTEIHCEVGDHYEEGEGLVSTYPLDGDGIMCRVECQADDDVYLDVFCDDLSPFTADDGSLSLRTTEDIAAYNQMILSYLSGKPVLSPNPVSDLLTIKYLPEGLLDGRLEVIASDGRVVYTRSYQQENTLQADMGYLPNGLYLIRLIDANDQQIYQEKVIKSE